MFEVLIYLFLFFNFIFMIALIKKDFSVIDIAWGISFFLIFITLYTAEYHIDSMRIKIIGFLVFIWAARLSGYIFYRSLKKGKEDYRYANWRKQWGAKANQIAYVKVYMLQMILSLCIASPLILIFKFDDNKPFGNVWDFLGLSLWGIGFLFEAIGDYQKNRFKSHKENKDKFCNVGVWKYSRHANYFGEACLWWGVFLISINIVPFYLAIWGPLLLNILLLKVSGVAMLEESYEKRPGFKEYKQTTRRFIPWLPREFK